jgi:hypothetical protein
MVGWWRVPGVRVAGVLFGPVEGALAGLAEFFFVWGGAVGFGFAVGHDTVIQFTKWKFTAKTINLPL